MIRHVFFGFLFFVQSLITSGQVRTLDFFLQQGLSNSPLLKDLNNQLRVNFLDSLLIKANRLPQINVDGLLNYAPIIHGYGYSEAITNGGNYISVIDIHQPIFNKKAINIQYSGIGLQNQAVVNSTRIAERDLKKTITALYLTSFAIYSQSSFERVLLDRTREEETLLKQLVENGIYRQTDYLSFLVEMQSMELHLIDLQTEYQKAISGLNIICGISDTTDYQLSMPTFQENVSPRPSGFPFFNRFIIDSLRIQNEKLLIDQAYVPKVDWYTDAGIVSNDLSVVYKNFGISFGLSFTVPVWDGNQRKLNYEKLKATEINRKTYQDYFRTQFHQQLRQLDQELRRVRELIPRMQEQMKLAETIIRQDKQLLNTGGISITDYVIAKKNYIQIQSNLNTYQVHVLQIMNEINYWKE